MQNAESRYHHTGSIPSLGINPVNIPDRTLDFYADVDPEATRVLTLFWGVNGSAGLFRFDKVAQELGKTYEEVEELAIRGAKALKML